MILIENIAFKKEFVPKLEDVLDLFNNSGYFPIEDKNDTSRIIEMFKNANLLVTAWHDDKLVGISRAITDFCYCCYLSDLVVHDDYKKSGIGKQLVKISKDVAGERCKLILQSNASAESFYEKIGMQRVDSAFIIQRDY